MLWNATNIQNKKHELQRFLHEQQIDIAIITETWLGPKDKLHFPQYNVRRKNWTSAPGEPRRGGVLIATHKNMLSEDCIQITTSPVETLTIKTNTKTTAPLVITAVYVPPRHRITAKDLNQAAHQNKHVIYITGGATSMLNTRTGITLPMESP